MAKKSGGVRYRDAVTGRYVSQQHSKRNPSTTVGEKIGGGRTGAARSAKNGRFVSTDYAKRNPRTTVNES